MGQWVWSLRLVTSGIANCGSLFPSGHHMGLRQDANPRVSLAAADLSTRTRHHRSQARSNDKRTLVTHTPDDGRSSLAKGASLRYRLENEGRQHPPSGTPGDVLRSRGVWLFERVFPECVGCGVEQGSKTFFRRRAVDPVELGQDRGRCQASNFDPPESRLLNRLQCRSASNPLAEHQSELRMRKTSRA